ncbi:hypothetical protein DFH09DRAFT_1282184 [Mycena vulgaris]|nr:hypothetical protein DFH09DRAFT_1282184 [Mycena vulgaris]
MCYRVVYPSPLVGCIGKITIEKEIELENTDHPRTHTHTLWHAALTTTANGLKNHRVRLVSSSLTVGARVLLRAPMTPHASIYITRVTTRRIGTSENGRTVVSEPKDPTCLVESEALRSGIVDWYTEDGRKTQELNDDQKFQLVPADRARCECRLFEFEQSWIDDEWKRIRSVRISFVTMARWALRSLPSSALLFDSYSSIEEVEDALNQTHLKHVQNFKQITGMDESSDTDSTDGLFNENLKTFSDNLNRIMELTNIHLRSIEDSSKTEGTDETIVPTAECVTADFQETEESRKPEGMDAIIPATEGSESEDTDSSKLEGGTQASPVARAQPFCNEGSQDLEPLSPGLIVETSIRTNNGLMKIFENMNISVERFVEACVRIYTAVVPEYKELAGYFLYASVGAPMVATLFVLPKVDIRRDKYPVGKYKLLGRVEVDNSWCDSRLHALETLSANTEEDNHNYERVVRVGLKDDARARGRRVRVAGRGRARACRASAPGHEEHDDYECERPPALGIGVGGPPALCVSRGRRCSRAAALDDDAARGAHAFCGAARGARACCRCQGAGGMGSVKEAGIPRSASTPGRAGGIWEGKAGAIWEGRAGAMWEGRHGYGTWAPRNAERKREPALSATLSASSSRPWALVAVGSSASLVSEEEEEQGEGLEREQEQEQEHEHGHEQGEEEKRTLSSSASSDSLSFSSKACEMRLKKGSSGSEASSFGAAPYAYAGSEGDDEGSDSEEGYTIAGVRYTYAASDYASSHGHGHGRSRSEYASSHGHAHGLGLTHGRAHSESSGATHGHGHGHATDAEDADYGRAYTGDAYGGDDVWMRARALSLARLRARKEVRRGWVPVPLTA